MHLVKRIDQEIEKRSLLKHPFYQMWSEGKLDLEALQGYAKEYFHLVKAVPDIVEEIAAHSSNENINTNLQEEREHIEPWIKFAGALGVSRKELEQYNVAQKTRDSVSKLVDLASRFDEGVAAMYAYEAEIPNISRTKLEGLAKYYNITSNDATEYQRIHSTVDVKHAAVWRSILEQLPNNRYDDVFNASVSSLIAQNMLLDAVCEKYVRSM
ncbi:MAG: iron-containing redox enzyme family protein [Nitrososphaerales archaeon]